MTPITLEPSSVAATVGYDGAMRPATLDAAGNLAEDTRYRLTWTGGADAIRDLAGSPPAMGFFDFTMRPRPFLTAPTPGYNTTTRQAALNPNATLAARTRYTVTPTTGIKDLGGNAPNPNVSNRTWSFTTGG